jgi:hypothetical protein
MGHPETVMAEKQIIGINTPRGKAATLQADFVTMRTAPESWRDFPGYFVVVFSGALRVAPDGP